MLGIIIMTILALIFGISLVNLEDKFDDVRNLLPGYNCGACGYLGCDDLANKIKEDPSLYKKCKALRGEGLVKMQEYIKEKYNIE